MEPWVVGLVALVVVGIAVIVLGAFSDRTRNRRRAAELLAPPRRSIPRLAPDARGPAYVTELQARRPPGGVSVGRGRPHRDPSPSSGGVLERDPSTSFGGAVAEVRVEAGWASADFQTDKAGRRAVLEHPVVLVCSDGVGSMRELLPVLERVLRASVPLVLVAPTVEPQTLGTLEVNVIQQKVAMVVVLADEERRRQVAELSGATPVDRSDRQAGFVSPTQLGRVERWVSTHDASLVTRAAA